VAQNDANFPLSESVGCGTPGVFFKENRADGWDEARASDVEDARLCRKTARIINGWVGTPKPHPSWNRNGSPTHHIVPPKKKKDGAHLTSLTICNYVMQ
jgi:hypothetical protein